MQADPTSKISFDKHVSYDSFAAIRLLTISRRGKKNKQTPKNLQKLSLFDNTYKVQ